MPEFPTLGAPIVKPRSPSLAADRPLIVIDSLHDQVLEETGEIRSLSKFLLDMPAKPPSMVIANDVGVLLNEMNELFKHDPLWSAKVVPVQRPKWGAGMFGDLQMFSLLSLVDYFGWKGERKQKNRYHYCISPRDFLGGVKTAPSRPAEMLRWGVELRSFLLDNGLNPRPSQGGVARQFLRDPRFYPEPRRKIPRRINDRVRPHIGIAHYEIREAGREFSDALYLDQSGAHHYAASNVHLPDSNCTIGLGFDRSDGFTAITDQRAVDKTLDGFMGLIHGYIELEDPNVSGFRPDFLQSLHPGRSVHFYSNELPLIRSLGGTVTGIIALWGSWTQDAGLSKYAQWATTERSNRPDWLKSVLLATYGAMATRPRSHETAIIGNVSKPGEQTQIVAGSIQINANLYRSKLAREPQTNNLLHWGMIEAETRVETLMCANWLQQQGFNVLHIYVDGIIVEDDGTPLPPLPDPWRLKYPLKHYKALHENAFTSLTVSKIPGGAPRAAILAASNGHQGRVRPSKKNVQRALDDRWSRRFPSAGVIG